MEKQKKLTNMEVFLFTVGICCVVLGVGFTNIILLGVAGLTAFLGLGSMFIRKGKQNKNE